MEKFSTIENWYFVWDQNNSWVQIGGDVEDEMEILTGPVETVFGERHFETFNKGRYHLVGSASTNRQKWAVPSDIRHQFKNGFVKEWSAIFSKLSSRRITRHTPHKTTPKRPPQDVDTLNITVEALDKLNFGESSARKPRRAKSRRRKSEQVEIDTLAGIPAKPAKRPSNMFIGARITYAEDRPEKKRKPSRKRKSTGGDKEPKPKRSKSVSVAVKRNAGRPRKNAETESGKGKRRSKSASVLPRKPVRKEVAGKRAKSPTIKPVTVEIQKLGDDTIQKWSRQPKTRKTTEKKKPETAGKGSAKRAPKGRKKSTLQPEDSDGDKPAKSGQKRKKKSTKNVEPRKVSDSDTIAPKLPTPKLEKTAKLTKKQKKENALKVADMNQVEYQAVTPMRRENKANAYDTPTAARTRPPVADCFATPSTTRQQIADDFTTPAGRKPFSDNFTTPAGFQTPANSSGSQELRFTTPGSVMISNSPKASKTPNIGCSKKQVDNRIAAENRVNKRLQAKTKGKKQKSAKKRDSIPLNIAIPEEKENDSPNDAYF